MNAFYAVAYREYRIRLTNPILPLWDVVVPVVYLIVFGSSLDRAGFKLTLGATTTDYPTFFLGGVLAMVTFSVAMNSSYAFFEDLQSGIFHELLTYPFPRRDLLLGKLAFNTLFSVAGSALCIGVGVLALGIAVPASSWLPMLTWVILGTAGWYFVFSWLSLRMRGFNAYHTATSSMYLFLMFVSNLFYPAATLPPWIRWLAALNPITWQTDLLRYYSGAQPWAPTLLAQAVAFIAFLFCAFFFANRKLNGPVE